MNRMNIKKFNLKNRRLFLTIIIVFSIFIIGRVISRRSYLSHSTVFPVQTVYKVNTRATSYLVYNENVVDASMNGIAVYNASEGQKVKAGYEIASINLMDDVSDLKDELIKINAAINDSEKTKEKSNNSFEISSEDIATINRIQNYLKDKSFQEAILEINSLDLSSNHNVVITDYKKYQNYSKEQLEKMRDELIKQISKSNIEYRASDSGIVSYLVDGLEDKYKYSQDNDSYTYEYLEKNKNMRYKETRNQVEKNEHLFKLINNFEYKILLKTNNINPIESLKEGSEVKVIYNDVTVDATILTINKSKNGVVYVLKSDKFLERIYDKRIKDVILSVNREKSYKIPSSSLVKRGSIHGVYVEEIHGLVRFVPVNILSRVGDDVFISRGNRDYKIQVDKELERTVNANDAVVIYPDTVEDSQILN